MEYYAHISDSGEKQSVLTHLQNVAALASGFSIDFLKPFAAAIGNAHDIGKYTVAFQERLHDSRERFEHSACGAIAYSRLAEGREARVVAPMLEYCIAGHHTGLPDGGCRNDDPDNDVTLYSRLNRADRYTGKADYSAYQNEIKLDMPDSGALLAELTKDSEWADMLERYAFFTRYLFSCLTDADYLDTEHFCCPSVKRALSADFSAAEEALDRKLSSFTAETPLQKARSRLQEQAVRNAKQESHISILNMPTGSGKTLCSLKIALQKLRESGGSKKRIIYVIPYTSIIEQTAEVFEEIFGAYADILQHHSNYCFDDCKTEALTAQKLKLASENWDAPFIITTSVRFFESLYHFKGSGLRRLHNTADAIIVFDEIHLLPIDMLQPCLRGIGYITRYLNSEAIFLSATMPDYTQLFAFYLPGYTVKELLPDRSEFSVFQKCRYVNLGKTDFDSVLEKAAQYTSSLIVVNRKKTAFEVYQRLTGEKYHLSTFMTPYDRSETIRMIRSALACGRQITVVSTSLIEAGVDFDFRAVFRQCAGLDNILQSGGRCNREGKYESGNVYIFETDEPLGRDLQLPANLVSSLLTEYEDIASTDCIETYYRRLFEHHQASISHNTIAGMPETTGVDSIPFRTYAEQFRFIREDTIGVVVCRTEEAKSLVAQFRAGNLSVRRRLQKYTVSLRLHTFEQIRKMGIVDDFGTGLFVLTDDAYYSGETGLRQELANDVIFG